MLKNFIVNEDGQGMIEYALIIAAAVVVFVVAALGLSKAISNKINETSNTIKNSEVSQIGFLPF